MANQGQSDPNDDSHERSLAPGVRLSHYEITGKIGEGGMGAVYKAIDVKLDRPVALKVISRESITPADRRRFAREAHAASALNHPNIVTIYEYDSIDGIDFIAMECVDGKGLNVLLAEHAAGAPFPLPLRLDYMRRVASALTTDQALRAGYPRTEIEGEPELATLRADRRYHTRMARVDPGDLPK